MLSSEPGADRFRLALWSAGVQGTQEDLHTPEPPATLVDGSHQLLRERPLGTEVSLECVFHLLSSRGTRGKLSGSHTRMDPMTAFPCYPNNNNNNNKSRSFL